MKEPINSGNHRRIFTLGGINIFIRKLKDTTWSTPSVSKVYNLRGIVLEDENTGRQLDVNLQDKGTIFTVDDLLSYLGTLDVDSLLGVVNTTCICRLSPEILEFLGYVDTFIPYLNGSKVYDGIVLQSDNIYTYLPDLLKQGSCYFDGNKLHITEIGYYVVNNIKGFTKFVLKYRS